MSKWTIIPLGILLGFSLGVLFLSLCKNDDFTRKTDPQQPAEAQAGARRIQRAGIFSRIAAALQAAFHRVFPPLYCVSLDTTLSLNDLQSELDSIRRLKRKGARVRVLYWRHDTELFRQLPCNDCPKRPEYLTERIRRQEVVREILDELFGVSSEALPDTFGLLFPY